MDQTIVPPEWAVFFECFFLLQSASGMRDCAENWDCLESRVKEICSRYERTRCRKLALGLAFSVWGHIETLKALKKTGAGKGV